jgi:hypothetical protein
MIASDSMNAMQPSLNTEEIKPQRIMPAARYGKKSWSGVLKIPPKTNPIAAIITAMLIVSHKGPSVERL